jgi:hypothetical protein
MRKVGTIFGGVAATLGHVVLPVDKHFVFERLMAMYPEAEAFCHQQAEQQNPTL